MAEMASVGKKSVASEDRRMLDRPQLRDHAWASTVQAFQGRLVDNAIAVMEADRLTTQKNFHLEISRARHRAELVTDDAKALRERLEAMTGKRVSALEGIGAGAERPPARGKATDHGRQEMPGRSSGTEDKTRDRGPERIEHDLGL